MHTCLFEVKNKKTSDVLNKLFYGMVFSVGGDASLVYKELFILGKLSFGIAQTFFIRAFGFDPLKPHIGIILASLVILILSQIVPNIDDSAIKVGLPFYATLLGTMTWRALARVSQRPHLGGSGCLEKNA